MKTLKVLFFYALYLFYSHRYLHLLDKVTDEDLYIKQDRKCRAKMDILSSKRREAENILSRLTNVSFRSVYEASIIWDRVRYRIIRVILLAGIFYFLFHGLMYYALSKGCTPNMPAHQCLELLEGNK